MTPETTHISLLGRVAIQCADGTDAGTLAGRRSEIVFAFLALEHRRSVSRDELAEALWPELLPDTWNAALRSVLSDVRRFLQRAGFDAAETLVTEQGRLRLHLPPGTVLDVDQARADLAEARRLLAAGEAADAATVAERAADAAALPFLSFHDEGWAGDVRTDLDRLHIDALEVLGRALADTGDAHAALAAADRLVRADPFLESAHRLRITMLGETGDRAGALKAFERCKDLLAAELGITPSPETEEALRAALDGTPAAGTAPVPAFAPARGLGTTVDAGAGGVQLVAPRFGRLSVLVVEDHDFQRRTTLALLRGLGVGTLQEAADGQAALALLDDETTTPDVIVCDIDMPGMDGVEFIRNVAERRLASAVVFASGLHERVLATVRAASEGYGLQVLGAVSKPLNAAGLEGMLAAYRPQRRLAATGDDPSAALAALRAGLEDGTLAAAFSPVIDLAVGRVAGVRVSVAPGPCDDLAVAADAAGLGRPLIEHLLRAARDDAAPLDLHTYVELSPTLLTDVSLADGLAGILRDRVVLVAGAGALAAEGSPAMLDLLARLRVKGYGLCADGVETGALDRLPLTHVQLPSALIADAAASGDASALQPAVDAARLLGVPMIGACETSDEFDLVLQVGCSFAHGSFLAPAVTGAELPAVARDWAAPPVAADQRG